MPDTLPDLVRLEDSNGDWDEYVELLYQLYIGDLVRASLTFRGLPLRVQYRPPTGGKGYGFWHVISEGKVEDDRTPDLRRCERIRWISWLILHPDQQPEIAWWEDRRGGNTHVVLWHRSANFAVVLAKRRKYYLLKTAYVVGPHRAKQFEREWREYWGKG